jgi:NADH:ubiquinone oxidoreductase subunit 5 (subunit L)/multisubunit Na+/H+ antiporter MnhA subunit
MNDEKMLRAALLLVVFVPTIGAFFLPVASKASVRFRNALAAIMVLTALAGSLVLIPQALNGHGVELWLGTPAASVLSPALQFNFMMRADALAVFMACVSSLVSTVIVFYSFGYIAKYKYQNEYYLMVVLFLGAMMGLVFSSNLILLYIFWEITAIASWRLIGFFRRDYEVRRADKAFLVTIFGALMMLLGFVWLYVDAGSFDLLAIARHYGATIEDGVMTHGPTRALPNAAVAFILIGILSKSATLPFHTWLPDAGVAPSPVTALLHAAVLVKIGVYVFARLFIATFTVSEVWHVIVPWVAAASALVAAGAAMVDTDLKRIIAYSTVSQIGFIFLGLSVAGLSGDASAGLRHAVAATAAQAGDPAKVAITGSLLYILMHGIAKGGLFLCAGLVEHSAHTKDIRKMGGLIKTMPFTAVAFLLCAFSVMGIPPFGGFFSKYMVMAGAAGANLGVTIVFMVGAFMTIIYLFRVFNMVFLGEAKTESHREGTPIMVASVTLLGALSILSGLFIWPCSQFALRAVSQIQSTLGMVK